MFLFVEGKWVKLLPLQPKTTSPSTTSPSIEVPKSEQKEAKVVTALTKLEAIAKKEKAHIKELDMVKQGD